MIRFALAALTTATVIGAVAQQSNSAELAMYELDALRIMQPLNLNSGQLAEFARITKGAVEKRATYEEARKALIDKNASLIGSANDSVGRGSALAGDLNAQVQTLENGLRALDQEFETFIRNQAARLATILRPEQTQSIWYTDSRRESANEMIREIRGISDEEWRRRSDRYVWQMMGQSMRQIERQTGVNLRQPGRGGNRDQQREARQSVQGVVEQLRNDAMLQLNNIRRMTPQQAQNATFTVAQQQLSNARIQEMVTDEMVELLLNPAGPSAVARLQQNQRAAQN
ncbi:MAG: hypothetical protein HUU60_01240 [Armatimonadetes bacterium]|nr:hypothetical protein [Armatimonadota bacterium]